MTTIYTQSKANKYFLGQTAGYFKEDPSKCNFEYIKIINNYFKKYESIKTEKQNEKFKNINPPMFGTYKNVNILQQIEMFEKTGNDFFANNIVRNDFKKCISKILN